MDLYSSSNSSFIICSILLISKGLYITCILSSSNLKLLIKSCLIFRETHTIKSALLYNFFISILYIYPLMPCLSLLWKLCTHTTTLSSPFDNILAILGPSKWLIDVSILFSFLYFFKTKTLFITLFNLINKFLL